ncbi:MAG: response regulator [Bacteroidales bacterium]|nr:response regulator [Candidatus Liminaster caballi]
MKKATNDFDSFLNECQTYVWEWYIPEQKVRFGIPSLNSLWLDDFDKNIKLATMLERVHPDDIEKIFVRHTSPLYRSDKMFEVDIRLNVAAELMPDGKSSGKYEWYGFRGKTVRRDEKGNPVYCRGVAINIDRRVRVQKKLLANKDRLLQQEKQHTEYCANVMQEVSQFIATMASYADGIITGEMEGTREERLLQVNKLKDQGVHILDLVDKARQLAGGRDPEFERSVQHLTLWEHMAELQQIYSLKLPDSKKIYFSNLYDSVAMDVNVKLLDMLLENVVVAQSRNTRTGYLTMNYQLIDQDNIQFCVSCTESDAQFGNLDLVLTEAGMSLSVCRLMAKRLYGEITVRHTDDHRLHYLITLPVSAQKETIHHHKLEVFDEIDDDDDDQPGVYDGERTDDLDDFVTQASVMIGATESADIYRDQHLFNTQVAYNTDSLWDQYQRLNPDIVFVDYNLPGTLQIDELIQRMHALHADTPIIVTAQYAARPLHRRIQHNGARYLLNNPLSLRKINMMIKKYLK